MPFHPPPFFYKLIENEKKSFRFVGFNVKRHLVCLIVAFFAQFFPKGILAEYPTGQIVVFACKAIMTAGKTI
jgi:hypothetical protein